MEGVIRYFEQYGLFQPKDGSPERAATASLGSVANRIDNWYDSFWDISLKYCEGNVEAAERFMDTSVYMFYYRIKQKTGYTNWYNEQLKQK